MKAVILAAGMSTRLRSLIPKPLTTLINGRKIMDYQVERLAGIVGEKNIYVIVGYKKDMIMEAFPNLTFVYNNAYALNNTAKSLHRALSRIDEDTIWTNGDVFFETGALNLLVKSKTSACLVNKNKCGDEEIKYTLNGSGFIDKISKEVKNGLGEAVGINLIKKNDLPNFVRELEKVGEKDYFEKALENLTKNNKIELAAIDIGNNFVKEIDFQEDLVEVESFLKDGK
ncbi:MAG: Bifunctional protein GlmU [candidate division WS2 bacterium ADurb.Bin280]|uniref:Bifunctional protein GlmU n=1 Tax=candidate division WS2 bacterium ADurb.Bin280 TaxID=1852829 RepID=A0A1V5SC92_9BACT|nr:MAG: Bifunctional protein GlmU [candidate division WS2 bacterium ADurb.Bin280]